MLKRISIWLVILGSRWLLVDVLKHTVLFGPGCHAEYLYQFETSLDSISNYMSSPHESQSEYIVEKVGPASPAYQ